MGSGAILKDQTVGRANLTRMYDRTHIDCGAIGKHSRGAGIMRGLHPGERAAEVSVVIPAFNAEPYLAECLESVFAQEVRLEVVVVDDGSTDGTRDVVQRYGHRVNYVARTNSGPSASRNAGAHKTTAQLITFFDADDVMSPGKLRAQVEAFHRHADLGCVMTDYRDFTATGPEALSHFNVCDRLRTHLAQQHDELVFLTPKTLRALLAEENFVISGSPMFRREAFLELGGFDEELTGAEDFDLIYRYLLRHRIGILRRVGFERRVHTTNLSSRVVHMLRLKAKARAKLAALESDRDLANRLWKAAGEYQLGLAEELGRGGETVAAARELMTPVALRNLISLRGMWATAWCLAGSAVHRLRRRRPHR